MFTPRSLAVGLVVPLVLLSGCSEDSPADAPIETTSEEAPDSTPDDVALAGGLITKGLAALDEGEPEEAARLFTSALDLEPGNVFAHYNLGYLAQLNGRVGSALGHYTSALETQPDFTPALYNLAILTESADLPAAVDLYQRVVDSNGGDARTFFRLGHALIEVGQLEQGQDLVAEAIELDQSLEDEPAPTYS